MPTDNDDNSDAAQNYENLLSLENVGLVTLPWLHYQKAILSEIKKNNEDLTFVQPLISATIGSQIGLMKALKKTRLKKILDKIGDGASNLTAKKIQGIFDKIEKFSGSSNEFLEFYESVLDTMILEIDEKLDRSKKTAKSRKISAKKKT